MRQIRVERYGVSLAQFIGCFAQDEAKRTCFDHSRLSAARAVHRGIAVGSRPSVARQPVD